MRKFALLAALAASTLSLGACQTQGERAGGGALIGAGTGALIGGLATGRAGGALAGAAIGGVGGAMVGAATAPCPGGLRPRTDRYGNALYTPDGRARCVPDGDYY